jgi:NAD(P)-dependent dehydrogenase (short-subunit alcohol dehydrogenase family)
MSLAGKKVVIVGGSSGIGLATAELAKREGAAVIIASRNATRLDAIAEKLNAIAIATDVTSDESVENLFRRTGPVDHVVITAAQLRTGPFKTVPMDDVRATMESKFWGARQWARARAGTCSRQCGLTGHHRYADPRRDAGGGAARHARQDRSGAAGRARRCRGGRGAADPRLHEHRLCDGIDCLSRWRGAGHLNTGRAEHGCRD